MKGNFHVRFGERGGETRRLQGRKVRPAPTLRSGHFLVEATEYMALALATDPYVETEVSVEEDLLYWKRRVVERCIYGVDKNPLAVELAKLSLWLATVAADKPLSFLDHHLQCGDSLIGARVADLGWAPPVVLSKKAQKQLEQQKAGQMNMFEYLLSQRLPVVMGRILEITEVESDSYETVQAKEAADQAVRELKAPFQAVANLWVSAYFGNEFAQSEYDEALGLIGRPDELLSLPAVQRSRGMMCRDERTFTTFHWELAFPEVFYDRNGQPLGNAAGFNAVVGNPPYVSFGLRGVGKISPQEQIYYRSRFAHSAEYKLSTYAMFMELGASFLCERGRHSFIVPDSFLLGQYFTKIRSFILDHTMIHRIVLILEDFWPAGTVGSSVVYVIRRADSPRLFEDMLVICAETLEDFSRGTGRQNTYTQEFFETAHLKRFRLLFDPVTQQVVSKMEKQSQPMYEYVKFYSGLIGKKGQSSITIKGNPSDYSLSAYGRLIHSGGNLDRYSLVFSDYYIPHKPALYKSGYDVEKYQAPKLFMNQTGDTIKACFDDQGLFCLNNMHIGYPVDRVYDLKFVNALLCSRLMNFYYHSVSLELGRALAQIDIETIDQLPTRCIAFITPLDKREQLVTQYQTLYSAGSYGALLAFINGCLAADPEQSDVIHDLLVYLAEWMIEMNKQKQAAVEAFWLDLEGVTEAAAFEILRNKGKQERTLWKKAEACRPFVREESHSTRRLDESLGWSEDAFKAFVKVLVGKVQGLSDLVGVYRAHSTAYRELVGSIEATDWLIDQIVYKLYGLTEEEIGIVEGR